MKEYMSKIIAHIQETRNIVTNSDMMRIIYEFVVKLYKRVVTFVHTFIKVGWNEISFVCDNTFEGKNA